VGGVHGWREASGGKEKGKEERELQGAAPRIHNLAL
jgi:hypothetical protein